LIRNFRKKWKGGILKILGAYHVMDAINRIVINVSYLKKRNNSIKIKLEYIYNLNKIILIQNYWKKYLKIRQNKLFDNNCENLLPKSIPFKLDNFDINDSTEPNIIIKNAEIIKNNNIYLKKNV